MTGADQIEIDLAGVVVCTPAWACTRLPGSGGGHPSMHYHIARARGGDEWLVHRPCLRVHASRLPGNKLASVDTGAGDPPAADPCGCGGCCLEPCIRARGSGGITGTRITHHAGKGHSDGKGRVHCLCIPDCTCVYVCMFMYMRACMCVCTHPRMRT